MTKIYPLAAAALMALLAPSAFASEGGEIERQSWPFSGMTGQFDKAQLQRGFQVYREVCSNCHGLKRLSFRNLSEPGGPEFSEDDVKELAASWPNQIPDLNEAGDSAVTTKDKDGKTNGFAYVKRKPLPSDPILGPYRNEREARAAQNGALPPDLTLIAKARAVERDVNFIAHPFLMLGDVLHTYQEGGADYLYSLLTGYEEAPADMKMNDGMNFNKHFPGRQIAMPQPLSDGAVSYKDGTEPKLENYAKDVTAFLAWTADPTLNQRKRIGWTVMLYLIVTTALLYFGKQRIWAKIKH